MKAKIITAVWITGSYNDEHIIGRTLIQGKEKIVAIVSASGSLQTIPFNAIGNIKKLTIINKPPTICSTFLTKKKRSTIETLIADVLFSLNNQ